MAPKKKVEEEPPPPPVEEEEQEPPPPDPDEDTELETGLQLPLRPKDVLELWAYKSKKEFEDWEWHGSRIRELLKVSEKYATPDQSDIVRDFHVFNLAHTHAIRLDHRQAAVFIAIMDRVLGMMKSPGASPESKPGDLCTAAQAFQEFQRLIVAHSTDDPPQNIVIFRLSEAKMLIDFASSTLFKHYLLYQYCVNFDREVQTLRFSMGLHRPLPPPDLRAARPTDRKDRKRRSKELPTQGGDGPEDEEPEEPEELTEEQEIERLVEAKLRETESMLDSKLQDREQRLLAEYEQKKEEKAAAEPPKKGKK